jgi:hypothetical protein
MPAKEPEKADTNGSANLKTAYDQLCTSYRAIDDFRAKLLGFLPLVTGGGLILLTGRADDVRPEFFRPIGFFGIAVTAGLLAYELFCIRKCHALLQAGTELERKMSLPEMTLPTGKSEPAGQFAIRPKNLLWVINEPFAAAVIYPAVLAAWTYLAFYYEDRQQGRDVSRLVFIVGFGLIVLYDRGFLKNEDWLRMKAGSLLSLVPRPRKDSQHPKTPTEVDEHATTPGAPAP